MLGKAKTWHSGLSKAGKTGLYAVLLVFGMVGVSAASGDSSQPPAASTKPSSSTTQAQDKEPVVTTETIIETTPIAFSSSSVNDSNVDQGKTAVRTAGVDGVRTLTYEVTTEDGVQKDKKLIKDEITTAPIAQVTALGTKAPYVAPVRQAPASNCDPGYSPCVPNVSYDLDCGDIGFSVSVTGSDPHGFDRDGDGSGCESY